MVALIAAVIREEQRRATAGRRDAVIPMRPDHGQDIVDDLRRSGQPGYPLIGRLKGLAELRGIMTASRIRSPAAIILSRARQGGAGWRRSGSGG